MFNTRSITASLEEVENQKGEILSKVGAFSSLDPACFFINVYHSVNPPFICWGKHKRAGGEDFLVQMGFVIHMWGSFLAVILFTQQVLRYLRLLLFRSKSQPVDVSGSVTYKKMGNIVLQSSKHEEATLPQNICLSIISFGRYLLENVVKSGGNWEEDINEDVTNNAIFKVHFFAIIIYIDMVN